MNYIVGTNRNQYLLLPPVIEEWIPEEHPARVIDWFVESLDFSGLGMVAQNEETGRPSYAPQVMLKVLLYGYSRGERSSRVLERRTYEDLAYLWLTGNLHPDYRTIARFRQQHLGALTQLLKETLRVYAEVGVVFDGTLFADGTKLYANASDNEVASAERIERLEQIAVKILAEAETVDTTEDTQMGERNRHLLLQEQLAKVKEKIVACRAALATTAAKKVSLTDGDAKFMKHAGGHGKHLSYNGQLSVDDHGVIVEAAVVTKVAEDGELLQERVAAAEANTGQVVERVVADTGYYETTAVQELTAQGKAVVVPHPVAVQRARGKSRYFTGFDFQYLPESDGYRCPGGQVLSFKWRKQQKGKQYLIYVAEKAACQECQYAPQCYRGTESSQWGRRLAVLADRAFVAAYEQTMQQHRELVRRRKSIIEPVFGYLKSQLRFRRFLMRGLEKVTGEWSLMATVYNLRKLTKLLAGKPIHPDAGVAIPVALSKPISSNYFNRIILAPGVFITQVAP
jgi:transposase